MRQQTNETREKREKQDSRASNTVGAKPDEEVIQTSFRLPRSRWRKLQELCLDERASVQSIIVGALETEFAKRGLSF